MIVETYELTELTGTLEPEDVEAARALVEELGLEGQRGLYVGGGEAVNVYRAMTLIEQHVYEEVLTQKTTLGSYDTDYVPLRVLQVAAHARTLFGTIEVWHEPGAKDDPLLVGKRKSARGWGEDLFMLARWGEHLLPFEDLATMARIRWIAKARAKCEQTIFGARVFLEGVESQANAYFAGETVFIP